MVAQLFSAATLGAETAFTVEIAGAASGASLRLTFAGFPSEASKQRHLDAWQHVLAHLDKCITGGS
jgi:hypothetical protein